MDEVVPFVNPELVGLPSPDIAEWLCNGASDEGEFEPEDFEPSSPECERIRYADDEDFYESARGESDAEVDNI